MLSFALDSNECLVIFSLSLALAFSLFLFLVIAQITMYNVIYENDEYAGVAHMQYQMIHMNRIKWKWIDMHILSRVFSAHVFRTIL